MPFLFVIVGIDRLLLVIEECRQFGRFFLGDLFDGRHIGQFGCPHRLRQPAEILMARSTQSEPSDSIGTNMPARGRPCFCLIIFSASRMRGCNVSAKTLPLGSVRRPD